MKMLNSRAWADRPLPAAVVGLLQRPALTGAADYQAHLSAPAPCQLPLAGPVNNGDLLDMLTATESAWATCAARVDAVIQCHRRNHAQTSRHP